MDWSLPCIFPEAESERVAVREQIRHVLEMIKDAAEVEGVKEAARSVLAELVMPD